MEWYLRDNIDDFIVPHNHDVFEATNIEDVAPSQDDWCHWEISRSKDLGSRNGYYAASTIPSVEDLNFNRQNLYFNVSEESPHYQVEGSSNVSTCGQPSLVDCSTRNSKASFSDQPDFELDNDMEKMDDFCNSFLEDDQIFPDSMYRSLPFEDLLSNMGADPQIWLDSTGAENSASNSSSFPLFMDHNLEGSDKAADSSPPCLRPDKSDRSEGSPAEDVLCATNKREPDSTNVDEPKCFEETALMELEDVMLQLTKKTRICFRDALYRLAKTSEEQHMLCQNKSVSYSDKHIVGQTAHENSRGRPTCVEANTNVIDRTVANLMYNNKPCCDIPELLFA